ncbi:disintegrin and metalloproteinase domain-containing protein 18 isoform X10 [Canis lupus familiaris]|uniref:disintegrin and metalloproteinase domain-containing protein 18 isoform X10 n=1 Tax=Canis lupus familiaris TaxID=9615 RepID=UPI000BAA0885|nr:disintegrin and metalloproteinase domain-containing protein 18 isoform X10 [Canis lupus familiaris]XP_038415923.1 disintegrin and metalloproteinase domain-containing protein 18 isoform X10 [Canis lupus familiaris]|eukprot:XP_022259724.1 disintegrin and metalloproteinase domain-containing protein 18 isoform X11 [Canis lupus familiaris]
MFLLFALLSELGRLHARLDSEGILLHVTVPWKIRSNESENSEKQVIYIITIDEKPYTLHLRKHSFLSHNFLVYAYNETGFLHSESSYFKMHCHYQGYVADIPNSLATLSICSGLRGFLQFGNITFGIEPLESSASFEHIIYQVKNDDPDIPLLAENYSNSWQKNQPYKDNLSSQYSDAITLEGFSVIIAQLLGLKMGLTYDDINTCSCPRATCIMDRKAVGSSGIKFFSNCSMHDYRYFVSKFETKCLQNFPNLQPLYQNQSVCGNGILEPNEECDCGSQEECQFKKCCDFNTCKLKGSAKCGSGPCCTSNCEISVAGTPCRKIIDQECDFTEYCNGTSSNCVPDTYASNGMLCRLGTAYCYNGRCQTTDNQCAQIFGEGAQGAPFACFKEINSLHDKFGNCGFKNSQPLPCDQKDVLCGKLACVWPHKNTYKNDVRSAVYSYIQGHACISMTTGLSVRSDGRDYAYVADGTVCGAQMYCINKTCRKVHLMGYNCNAIAKCRGNGICNNLGNCHCFPGYRPPYCEFQIGSPGGSIDDGNVKKSDIIFIKEDYNAQQNNWLILSFYIVLPFIIIFTIMIIKRNEMRKSCKRENAEYEGERERGRDTGKEKSKCQAGNLTWNSILGPGSPWTPGCRLHQTAVPPGLPENLQCLDVVLKLSLIPGTSKCLSLVVSNTVKKVSSEFL